ncbi:esterase, PHB depolymerase family [Methylocella silvestris BL2]|uniref:Esterase, PHB depolymerase family n=1 Tax=Methylocella silvestris (strain DSM 15510 / CIP 108128 / LMG 27833 / NCIMB 13906 / BL2) TaxID=395965 RepID=B8EPH5_METSB|nr:PHB depolymerase family esterase [Methylocella silvestris]ACK50180.1 esterase, PHB depolymerase family [Methylocella silvestris BL2]
MFDKLRHGFAPGFEWAEPTDDDAAPETKPAGAQFVARSFTCAAGSRSYKLFVPSSAAKSKRKAMPLIVMLHGCKQDPDDFARGTRMNVLAEEDGFLVAYPQQSGSSNHMGCWNWFNLKDQARDSGETAIIAGIAREVMAEFSVDPERVFVAGLSAGGAMAANLSMSYPDIFRAVGIHSGLPCGAATDVVSAFNAMRHGASTTGATPPEVNVRTIVFQGGADRTVHPSNADLIVAFASTGIKGAVETRERGAGKDGVSFERTIIADAKGVPQVEYWALEDLGHAWSGGHSTGSFTDPNGPDASREMLRFFMQH